MPMVCESCRFEMVERMATDELPYKYELAGRWHLSGIVIYQCPKCKVESAPIPKIAQLHRLMAKILVGKPAPLAGSEIRFLRKNAGFPAKEFAALLGITAFHLSRVENETPKYKSLGQPADRLARLLGTENQNAVEGLRKLAHEAGQKNRKPKFVRPKFRLIEGKGWKAAA